MRLPRELIKARSKKDAADVLLAHGKLKASSALARALVAAVPRVKLYQGERPTKKELARERLGRESQLWSRRPGLRYCFISRRHGSFETKRPALRTSRLSSLKNDISKASDLSSSRRLEPPAREHGPRRRFTYRIV